MSTDEPIIPPESATGNFRSELRIVAKLATVVILMYAGVILPAICFEMGFPERPHWQSGNLGDFAALLLSHKPSLVIYPFLLYNVTCMGMLIVRRDRSSEFFVVRFGIYTGVVLALQYWVIFSLAFPGDQSVAGCLFITGLGAAIFAVTAWIVLMVVISVISAVRKINSKWLCVFIGLAVFIELFVRVLFDESIFSMLAGVGFFCSLMCSPALTLGAYAFMSWSLIRHSPTWRFRFTLAQLMILLTWAAVYMAAWRTAVVLMWLEYAKLPTEPTGDCYIATAAAAGHRRVVGGKMCSCRSGKRFPVNDQMRCFKATELALLALCPTAHRMCRTFYDRLGPRLASRLVHPLLADMAYVTLKPAEWVCRGVLSLAFFGQREMIARLYCADHMPSTDGTSGKVRPLNV